MERTPDIKHDCDRKNCVTTGSDGASDIVRAISYETMKNKICSFQRKCRSRVCSQEAIILKATCKPNQSNTLKMEDFCKTQTGKSLSTCGYSVYLRSNQLI